MSDKVPDLMDCSVVAKVGQREMSKAELSIAFDRVCDQKDWKLPINKTIDEPNEVEEIVLREAVIFFTGSVPTFTIISRGRVNVRALGYYEMIGV